MNPRPVGCWTSTVQWLRTVEGGASFIQTQFCLDVPCLRGYARRCVIWACWACTSACIVVGIGPLRSEKAAELTRTRVPSAAFPLIPPWRGSSDSFTVV